MLVLTFNSKGVQWIKGMGCNQAYMSKVNYEFHCVVMLQYLFHLCTALQIKGRNNKNVSIYGSGS